MTHIVPTLLATTESSYKEAVDKIESSALFKDGWVQIDLMDNKFVPNKSIGLDVLSKYPFSGQKEAQLMVEDPLNWVDKLVALQFSRIIFPVEVGNTEEIIQKIKSYDIQVGISLNPETSVDKVIPFLDKIDAVLFMSVHPGFQRQEFIPETLNKIKELTKLRDGNKFLIEVDGGITPELARGLLDVGVDNLAVGSRLFNGDIQENMEKFWEAING